MHEDFEEIKVRMDKSLDELRYEISKMIRQSKIDTVVITILMFIVAFLIGWTC